MILLERGRVHENGDNTIYTREYFLESTEPYEELYSIESSFERERQLQNGRHRQQVRCSEF